MNIIIIPRAEAYRFRKVKINWHSGIDAIEMESGDYFIPSECLSIIPTELRITRDKQRFYVKNILTQFSTRELIKEDIKKETVDLQQIVRL